MSFALFSKKEKWILGAFSCCALLLRVPLIFRSARTITAFPYGDDAFYLFSIAKNLAQGHGASVDGAHLTSGFQPLILILYAPIFVLAHGWTAVRWTLLLNGIIAALFVWAIAWLVRSLERIPESSRFRASIIAAAIWTLSYPCFLQMTNGLETGLASLLLVLAMIFYIRSYGTLDQMQGNSGRSSNPWVLGIILGFAVLARIDIAIFVAITVFLLLWKKKYRDAIISGCMAFLISLPWWIFNWIHFKSLMPESGQAENIWPIPPHENLYRALQAISDIITLIIYLPDSASFPLRALWLILLIIGILVLSSKLKLSHEVRQKFRSSGMLPLLLFSVVLIIFYTFFFRAPHFMARYFQPIRILWSVLFAAGVAALWKHRSFRIFIGIASVFALVFFIDRVVHNAYDISNADLYDAGVWAAAHPEEKIGMLQSGIASFITPNVINLDGKVNDEALHAHQQGRLGEYLRSQRFTFIADEKPFIEDIAGIVRKDGLLFDSSAMIGRIQLMKLRSISP